MRKIAAIAGAALAALFALAALSCGRLDVVARDSERAFGELLEALPPDNEGSAWRVTAPDGAARFVWTGESAAVVFDIAPFADAGLDVSAFGNIADGIMVIRRDFGGAGNGTASPRGDFARIVRTARAAIGYHAAADHYGVNLGDGNLFEWAKDMAANDKDIVFALDPAPFIAAGADPSRIAGWVFTKVTVDDENGRPVEVDKILKPFDVR